MLLKHASAPEDARASWPDFLYTKKCLYQDLPAAHSPQGGDRFIFGTSRLEGKSLARGRAERMEALRRETGATGPNIKIRIGKSEGPTRAEPYL